MKKYIKNMVLLASCVATFGCSTPLSREAQQIMTINDGAVIAMMNCKELGFVTGEAGIWGGTAGLDMAYSNAKNQAALLSGANAILITSSQMNPTSIVNAKVYNCSESKPQKIEVVGEPAKNSPPKEDINVTIEKARKCQSKGGVWLDDQCVISIE
ncbi:hypothetical protein [Shewanella sp. UCD-KL12]|uniref:hypothetical protein n=1 Tax=Shewanella sp. UCD-KL12 TaxID=1917163 RepID=UPI00117EF39B|nr:hypothetical protein [Shewanella sp. UCD-KL12]